jgi:Uma2 family endonuclease
MLPAPDEQIFTQPPYICIEILSPGDTFPKLQDRFDDHLTMSVPNLWLLDPTSKRAWRITHAGHFEALDGILRTQDGQVVLPISELFLS